MYLEVVLLGIGMIRDDMMSAQQLTLSTVRLEKNILEEIVYTDMSE